MGVGMHTHMHTPMHVGMHTHMHTLMGVCMNTHMHTPMGVGMHTHMQSHSQHLKPTCYEGEELKKNGEHRGKNPPPPPLLPY